MRSSWSGRHDVADASTAGMVVSTQRLFVRHQPAARLVTFRVHLDGEAASRLIDVVVDDVHETPCREGSIMPLLVSVRAPHHVRIDEPPHRTRRRSAR